MKQVRALMKHLVPGIGLAIFQSRVPGRGPFFKKRCDGVFAAKISGKRFLKTAAKDHRSPRVFFLPAIHVAIAILPWTTEILANLRVAVDHRLVLLLSWYRACFGRLRLTPIQRQMRNCLDSDTIGEHMSCVRSER